MKNTIKKNNVKKIIDSRKTVLIFVVSAIITVVAGYLVYVLLQTIGCVDYVCTAQSKHPTYGVSYTTNNTHEDDFHPLLNDVQNYVIIDNYDSYQQYYTEIVSNKFYSFPSSTDVNPRAITKDLFVDHSLLLFKVEQGSVAYGMNIVIDDIVPKSDEVGVSVCGTYTPAILSNFDGKIFFVPVDKNIKRANIDVSWHLIERKDRGGGRFAIEKPIIYLYPEQETLVTVKLGRADRLAFTYPQYPMNGWQVIAQPNGSLIDPKTGRSYYSLYWEGLPTTIGNFKEGFVVKGESVASFLEEKLSLLGLTEREANEFIIYWLPKLEANQYNLIRFQTRAEIDQIMPLDIVPAPNTLVRVMMEFKGLDYDSKIAEQKLTAAPPRSGFVAVEWGGIEVE